VDGAPQQDSLSQAFLPPSEKHRTRAVRPARTLRGNQISRGLPLLGGLSRCFNGPNIEKRLAKLTDLRLSERTPSQDVLSGRGGRPFQRRQPRGIVSQQAKALGCRRRKNLKGARRAGMRALDRRLRKSKPVKSISFGVRVGVRNLQERPGKAGKRLPPDCGQTKQNSMKTEESGKARIAFGGFRF
jgi:hypothetical protein